MNARLARLPATGRSEVWPTIRRHAPLPTETVMLDLGELGVDVPALVTYEINPADGNERGRWPASLSIHSITVPLLGDVFLFVQAQHPDCLAGIVEKVEAKLRAEVV